LKCLLKIIKPTGIRKTMKPKKFSPAERGFTLIEIVVTLAIIAVIFAIASTSFNRVNSESNLRAAAESLTSDLRAAALSALNSEQFQLQTAPGWGVYLDDTGNSYTVFADFDGDKAYDSNEKFKTTVFSKNIDLGAIYFNSLGHTNGAVYFYDATAEPRFKGTIITSGTGDLEIQLDDLVSAARKSIWVNPFAAVTIE